MEYLLHDLAPVVVAPFALVAAFILGYLNGRQSRRSLQTEYHTPATLNRVRIALTKAGLDSQDIDLAINRMEIDGFVFVHRGRL